MIHCKEANIVFQGITGNGTVYSRQESWGLVLHESYAPRLSSSSIIKRGNMSFAGRARHKFAPVIQTIPYARRRGNIDSHMS